MNLKDIINQLASGELVQLNISGIDPDTPETDMEDILISDEYLPRVLNSIQLGLIALYTKFRLKEKCTTITLVPDQYTYILTEPDLLKIETIYDAEGNELLLNLKHSTNSIRTPNYNTIIVPEGAITLSLTVNYRAKHPKVNEVGVDMFSEIELPDVYMEPLLYFVASRIFNPIGVSNELHEGNNYLSKYNNKCAELESYNMQIDSIGMENKFTDRGWV